MHELRMLWELAEIVPRSKKDSTEYIALLESFAIHMRNLVEFFCFSEHDDYVRAQDYFDNANMWPAQAKLTAVLKNGLQRANEEVAHLTTGRKAGNPTDKAWDTTEFFKEVEAVARDFAQKASPKKLHADIVALFKMNTNEIRVWVENNVPHSNVSSSFIGPVGTGRP